MRLSLLRLVWFASVLALALAFPRKRGVAKRIPNSGRATGLHVYEAGWGKEGPKLKNGMEFCPAQFSSRGFTVVCKTEGKISHVKFLVNGLHKRTETQFPYAIAGDSGGMLAPWIDYPYPGNVNIACVPDGQRNVSVTVHFSCPKDFENRLPPATVPEKKPLVPGGLIPRSPPRPTSNIAYRSPPASPSKGDSEVRRLPKSAHRPRPKAATPKKQQWKHVYKPKPKPTHKPQTLIPIYRPKPKGTKKPHSGKPIYKPRPKNTQKAPRHGARTSQHIPFSRSNCVSINGKNFQNSNGLGPWGWQRKENGVVYKDGDNNHRTVKPIHQLTYSFTVPKTSHYAIVLEMTTRHYTEFNVSITTPISNSNTTGLHYFLILVCEKIRIYMPVL